MNKEDKKIDSSGTYPLSTGKDSQLRNQPEFIEEKSNDFRDPAIKNAPATSGVQEEPNKEISED